MYGISPEDRLWMVKRDQAERRQLSAADRMAAATRDGSPEQRAEAPRSGRTLGRHSWTVVAHTLHALAHPHVHVPTHHAAH